jgi:hypothetical protein
MHHRDMVFPKYIIVNTLHKGDKSMNTIIIIIIIIIIFYRYISFREETLLCSLSFPHFHSNVVL